MIAFFFTFTKNCSMKKFLVVTVVMLLSIQYSFATPTPPQPLDPIVPPQGDLPIDSNLMLLAIISIAYGCYKIYRPNQTSK